MPDTGSEVAEKMTHAAADLTRRLLERRLTLEIARAQTQEAYPDARAQASAPTTPAEVVPRPREELREVATLTFDAHPEAPSLDRAQAAVFAARMREAGFDADVRSVGEPGHTHEVVSLAYDTCERDAFVEAATVVLTDMGVIDEDVPAADNDARSEERVLEPKGEVAHGEESSMEPRGEVARRETALKSERQAVRTETSAPETERRDVRTEYDGRKTEATAHKTHAATDERAHGKEVAATPVEDEVAAYLALGPEERRRLGTAAIPMRAFGSESLAKTLGDLRMAATHLAATRERGRTERNFAERVS